MSRTALSRLEREAVRRRAARECAPHPADRVFWQQGDWATPDKLVCGRCFAILGQRRHTPPTRVAAGRRAR